MKKGEIVFIIFASIWLLMFLSAATIGAPDYPLGARIIAILMAILPLLIYLIIKSVKRSDEKRARGIMYGNQEINKRLQEADLQLSEARKTAAIIIQRAREDANKVLETANQDAQTIEKRKKLLENEAKDLTKEIDELNLRIESANSDLIISETTVYFSNDISSEEYKDKLTVLDLEYKEFIKSGKAVIVFDNEDYDTKKRFNDNVKQIIRCFNAEAKIIISSVTAANIDKMRGQLTKAFQTINNIFATDFIALDKQVLEMQLKELNLTYSYQQKKAQEQEEQKAIRAQMIEEEKVRREIEREKAKVEKEEAQFKNEINKLMKYLTKATEIEKQLYVDKIKELEDKVKLLEKDKENILQREQNTRAGYVYIISNIGSFGENIYKIGMTRRLEPMDRVKELGDASVPFEFDVHAMIFSEDAPTLETILHNTFKDNQVNLVNPRKEFYNVSLADIEKVVKENYNATVTFTQIAEAAQYRESVRIRSNK